MPNYTAPRMYSLFLFNPVCIITFHYHLVAHCYISWFSFFFQFLTCSLLSSSLSLSSSVLVLLCSFPSQPAKRSESVLVCLILFLQSPWENRFEISLRGHKPFLLLPVCGFPCQRRNVLSYYFGYVLFNLRRTGVNPTTRTPWIGIK